MKLNVTFVSRNAEAHTVVRDFDSLFDAQGYAVTKAENNNAVVSDPKKYALLVIAEPGQTTPPTHLVVVE